MRGRRKVVGLHLLPQPAHLHGGKGRGRWRAMGQWHGKGRGRRRAMG